MSGTHQTGFYQHSRASNAEHSIGARKEDVETLQKVDTYKSTQTAKEFLRNTNVSSVYPDTKMKIISVRKTDELHVAFKELIQHKILSLPVEGTTKEGYIGFIDILDVVSYVLHNLKGSVTEDSDFSKLLEQSEKMSKTTCGDVTGLSSRNQFHPVEDTAPLLQALKIMVNSKAQRLPIIDAGGHLVTIVTQSNVIAILQKNIEKFSFKTKTVGDLKLGLKDVLTVNKSSKAVDAFELITSKKITGLGVVDDSGVLIGNISASDLRKIGARAELVHDLFLNVEDFLKIDSQNGEIPPVIAVTTSSTFSEVMSLLNTTKSHRVFVIDDSKKPIGVISLVDALECIIDNA